jgi:uncharacterized membrane protein
MAKVKVVAVPRWPAVLAILATGALHSAMPPSLRLGPDWLMLLLLPTLLTPAVLAHRVGKHTLNNALGYVVLSVVALAMVWSLVSMVIGLPSHRDSPQTLLRGAASLWLANVLIFASWYWRLDAGGPNQRDLYERHTDGAFLFPQMILPEQSPRARNWRPGFVDYLFLAFNTSTAFSPTDVPVLSRWAKAMMMVQASISLMTVAIIVARAVNVL